MSYRVVSAVALAVAATAVWSFQASATDGIPGFYKKNGKAWYNHVTTDNSSVYVTYRLHDGAERTVCLPAGAHVLGPAEEITSAWYAGKPVGTG
ncbi:DUF6355 family natural product biosynthesis protein [Allokutzneria sp. NRRL B-24872]|uniref:DUF6355 family natural product biosynthesis protein n=1 Tax=Allokutzneria sp. NRRL B-24872 TaxID=1137961 RepID=UPI00117865C6|nr:DUF6355 family natural product biosynthesis protein [Allokutzneria sp. NRRL B-24872]